MALTAHQLLVYAVAAYALANPKLDLSAVADAVDAGKLVPAGNATVQAAIAAAIADQQAQAASVPAVVAQLQALAATATPVAAPAAV